MSMSDAPVAASDATSRSRAVSVRAVDNTEAAGTAIGSPPCITLANRLGRANLAGDVAAPREQRRGRRVRICGKWPKSQQ